MWNSRRAISFTVCIALAALAVTPVLFAPAQAQESDLVETWLTLVNELRLDEGLNPYKLSSPLSKAAQRHADDIATDGFADPDDIHLGSDGTHEQERITEAGYEAWTWNGGNLIVDENLWTGHGSPGDALDFFLEDPVHRDNILSDVYREIGIGVATDAGGRRYYVLDFGARPNVLPIFINDGAESTDNPEVAIRLTNETARPEGRGANFMGEAIEVRINDESTFEGLSWQSWTPLVSWTLPDTQGRHTVYVQFRDAAGRTAASADSIFLDKGTPTLEGEPSATATPVPASATPEPTATPVPPSPTPAPTATLVPSTPTPGPTTAAAPTLAPTPSSSPEPPTALSQAPTVTAFPTWTPLPSPEPTEGLATGSLGVGSKLLGLVAVLQGIAVLLGLYLALRRKDASSTSTSG